MVPESWYSEVSLTFDSIRSSIVHKTWAPNTTFALDSVRYSMVRNTWVPEISLTFDTIRSSMLHKTWALETSFALDSIRCSMVPKTWVPEISLTFDSIRSSMVHKAWVPVTSFAVDSVRCCGGDIIQGESSAVSSSRSLVQPHQLWETLRVEVLRRLEVLERRVLTLQTPSMETCRRLIRLRDAYQGRCRRKLRNKHQTSSDRTDVGAHWGTNIRHHLTLVLPLAFPPFVSGGLHCLSVVFALECIISKGLKWSGSRDPSLNLTGRRSIATFFNWNRNYSTL